MISKAEQSTQCLRNLTKVAALVLLINTVQLAFRHSTISYTYLHTYLALYTQSQQHLADNAVLVTRLQPARYGMYYNQLHMTCDIRDLQRLQASSAYYACTTAMTASHSPVIMC